MSISAIPVGDWRVQGYSLCASLINPHWFIPISSVKGWEFCRNKENQQWNIFSISRRGVKTYSVIIDCYRKVTMVIRIRSPLGNGWLMLGKRQVFWSTRWSSTELWFKSNLGVALKPRQSFNNKARQQRGRTGRVLKLYFFGVIVILTRSREIRSLAKTRNNTERREIG